MRAITRRELTDLIRNGEGVVLVDHQARGAERPSTLHAVTCRWPAETGARTPLRFALTKREAVRWLRRERGDEDEFWQICSECNAETTGDNEDDRLPRRDLGEAVWTADRGRDIAFVVGGGNDRLTIAEFDSPQRPEVAQREAPMAATSSFWPNVGDRCFVDVLGNWQAATCAEPPDELGETITIEMDGVRLDAPRAQVRFRRLGHLLDPLADLGEHRAGDLERFRARANFMQEYTQMAAPARGLLGAASAAVDLYAHQVGVARRILADPVQRYLLADEVGLGKTIEAGFVIRQRLIDAPGSVVVVLVPPALRWQWEVELDTKFALKEIRTGGVEISSYDDERAFDRKLVPDLVVIDEAHRIAAGWGSLAPELSTRFEAARELAHRVPRLLLLSATPVLHREHNLLAMLHLLDPDTYRLDDLDSFTKRIRDRERIGELLLSLRAGAPGFLVSSRLPDLRETFAADERMQAIVDRIERSLKADDDQTEPALADARSHVSETYRLHRRFLRNRRASVATTAFTVRGRGGGELIDDHDPRRRDVDDWLERWRTTLLSDAHDLGAGDFVEVAAGVFDAFAAAATGDLEVLRDLVSYRREFKRRYRARAGLSPDVAAPLRRGFPRTEAQGPVLDELVNILGDGEIERGRRARRLAEIVAAQEGEIQVAFATAPATADALADAIAARGISVHKYTVDLDDAGRRPTIEAFLTGTGKRLLICDASGEEGLNLQAADCVLHLDLPLSTTRLEQRIGRADRHGDGPPVRSLALRPGPEDGFGMLWFRTLAHSFRVFDETTAPVQYAIETVEREFLQNVFLEGVVFADQHLADVAQRVADEQSRIDRLDSLDALARQDADDLQFVDAVHAAERRSENFAESVFRVIRTQREDLGALLAKRRGGGRIIEVSRKPPPFRIYSGVAERAIEISEQRAIAVGTPNVSLLRPGAPLVEAVRLQQEWDDRAQTAAIWRRAPEVFEDVIGVRCDLVIRADPAAAFTTWSQLEAQRPRTAAAIRTDADAPLSVAALQRRLDAYLPPLAISVWFGYNAEEIIEAELLELLETTIGEASIGPPWDEERWADLTRGLGAISIADRMNEIEPRARQAALDRSDAAARAAVAAERAARDWDDVERLLALRAEVSLEPKSAKRDLEAEMRVAARMIEAVRSPAAHWSGACLVALTPEAG